MQLEMFAEEETKEGKEKGGNMKVFKIVLIAVGIVLVIDLMAWLISANSELWFLIFGGKSPTLREMFR